jgi:hypothetical protein
VEDQISLEGLFQSGRKAFHELMRKSADEAHRVGHEVAAALLLESPRRRVERLEEAIVDGDAGAGERVEERRLAGVRVAGERDRRRVGAKPLASARLALPAEALEAPSQDGDSSARESAVRLKLGLAGASRPDAAVHSARAEALEVLPHAAHAREVVLELRQLDLELSLGAVRVLREDVEDQLGAVDDPRLQLVLELSLLGRAQLVVDEQRLRAHGLVRLLELDELALADEGPGVRPRSMLDQRSHRLHTGGPCELCDLVELAALVRAGGQH